MICSGCDFWMAAPARISGRITRRSPTSRRSPTRADGPGQRSSDMWVFDLDPGGDGAISRSSIRSPPLRISRSACMRTTGSVCAGVRLGHAARALTLRRRIRRGWRIGEHRFTNLAAGRYVFVISGSVIDGPSANPIRAIWLPCPHGPGAGHACAAWVRSRRAGPDETQGELKPTQCGPRARPRAGLFVSARTQQIFASRCSAPAQARRNGQATARGPGFSDAAGGAARARGAARILRALADELEGLPEISHSFPTVPSKNRHCGQQRTAGRIYRNQ